jgi:hypothetical protein
VLGLLPEERLPLQERLPEDPMTGQQQPTYSLADQEAELRRLRRIEEAAREWAEAPSLGRCEGDYKDWCPDCRLRASLESR